MHDALPRKEITLIRGRNRLTLGLWTLVAGAAVLAVMWLEDHPLGPRIAQWPQSHNE